MPFKGKILAPRKKPKSKVVTLKNKKTGKMKKIKIIRLPTTKLLPGSGSKMAKRKRDKKGRFV